MKDDLAFLASGLVGLSSVSPALMQQCADGYSLLDVRGKTVVDVGADWGNSVLYFWNRGAKKVIAYESDWRKRISLNRLRDRGVPVEIKGAWGGDEYPKADVLKMDCEGCEKALEVKKLGGYEQFAVALHEIPCNSAWAPAIDTFPLSFGLQQMGAKMVHKQKGEEVWVKCL